MCPKFSTNGDRSTNIEHVDWKFLDEKENIGQGAFSDVHKAIWRRGDGSRKVALKKFRNRNPDKYNEREITFLSEISHENIVTFYGISENTDYKSILILEYSECGSLDKYLYLPQEGCTMKYSDSLRWMYHLALGIAYLHQRNIIHRDLKPQNLLLFDNYRTLKICDFGAAIKTMCRSTQPIGTAAYMAPEIHKGEIYTLASDVYSFGIIVWEVLARKKPFSHLENHNSLAVSYQICRGKRPILKELKLEGKVPRKQYLKIEKLLKASWDNNFKKRSEVHIIVSCFVLNEGIYHLDQSPLGALT